MASVNLSTGAHALTSSGVGGGGALTVQTNTNNALFVDGNGNVGIGTTVPMAKLDVNGNTRIGISASISSHTINGKPYIYSTHNAGIPSYDPSNSDYGDLTIINSSSGRMLHLGATTGYCYLQSVNPWINPENIVFQPGGGYVGIGTTNPGFKLDIRSGDGSVFRAVSGTNSYAVQFWNGNIFSGNNDGGIYLGYTTNRWVAVYAVNGTIQTSDETLKDYSSLTYGLNEVMNIEPIQYKWKSQASLPDTDPAKHYEYYGFKASNLDILFPELVYNEGETLQVNYTELIPVLVKAIQEQQQQINALKAHLNLP